MAMYMVDPSAFASGGVSHLLAPNAALQRSFTCSPRRHSYLRGPIDGSCALESAEHIWNLRRKWQWHPSLGSAVGTWRRRTTPRDGPALPAPNRPLTGRDEAGKSVFKSFVTPKWFVRPPTPGH